MQLGGDLTVFEAENSLDETYQRRSSFAMANTAFNRTDDEGASAAVQLIDSPQFQRITSRSSCPLSMIRLP